ncbi:MAG: hypothetical protein P8L42_00435 [Flavicella sp.]|nr:hypothetical protein [Flavicella sp.]
MSFITCNDAMLSCEKQDVELEKVSNEHQDSHSHSEEDLCSPFCSCQCCQMVINTVELNTFELTLNSFTQREISKPSTETVQDVLHSLYQPPII